MLASLVLGFVMLSALRRLDLVWLHPTPMKPCLDVIALDASLWCWLLRAYPFPSRSVRCYACHTCLCHPLAFYATLHACLHVHAWVLLASVSSILQYNEAMDIRSKPTFVPCGHHLLFAFLLVCLPSCLLACLFAFLLSYLFVYLVAHHVSCHMLCLPCLSCLSVLCLFHMLFAFFFLPLLVYWFLDFAFACTHMERGSMELGHKLPSASKKGEDASM